MYKSTSDLTSSNKSSLSVIVDSSTHAAIILSLASWDAVEKRLASEFFRSTIDLDGVVGVRPSHWRVFTEI